MISRIAYYLPKTVLSNETLAAEFPDFSASKIEKKVGIRERRLIDPGETISDMAVKAAEKVLSGYERSCVDFLLLCTQSPDYLLPGSASLVQHRLVLATSIGAFEHTNDNKIGYNSINNIFSIFYNKLLIIIKIV